MELVGDPRCGEEDCGGGWWEVGCVGSGVVFLNGQNRHQNHDRTQVFRSFRMCRDREAFLHPPVSLASFVPHSATSLSRSATFDHLYRLTRTIHPIPTLPRQPPGFHVSLDTDTYHRPDPTLFRCCLLSPSSPLVSLVDAQVFDSTSFTHPPFPFYICCNPCCSPSFNLHCT